MRKGFLQELGFLPAESAWHKGGKSRPIAARPVQIGGLGLLITALLAIVIRFLAKTLF
jgi:hypothetical protein